MSATDSTGYFVELGEYNLILARADLSKRPRTVESLHEIWLGDTAAVDAAVQELRGANASLKAVTLLRTKGHASFLADGSQAQSITSPAAVENFLKQSLGSDAANWSWCNAANGRPPEGGARWFLDAAPASNTEEALGKLRGWSLDFLRCQSAPLALAGGLTAVASDSAPILLVDVSETRSFLFAITSKGVIGSATVEVGFDALAEATQTALGLKFRGSAARLMFNESYDFSDSAAKITEPLANAIKAGLPALGSPAPTQLVCAGILSKQTWVVQALAGALGLNSFKPESAAVASANNLTLGGELASSLAPTWLGVLSAIGTYDPRKPDAANAWNPILTGTPVAPAPVVPAILQEPAKPAEIPAIVQEPAKPAAATPPPAIIQEPAKPAAPKPAETPATPKPAVVITPPSKPATPPAKNTPPAAAKPADQKTSGKPESKPAPTPAKPAPAPSAAKAPAKPEPAKPAPAPRPAPAPVISGTKTATAAPFPSKKKNLPLIIGVAAALILGLGAYLYVSHQKEQQRVAEVEATKRRAAEEAAARRKAEEHAKAAEEARRKAEEDARKQAIAADEARRRAEVEATRFTTERLLSARGNLTVTTQPAGATVVVGELAPRSSPVSLTDLRLGKYSITITMPGYDTEKREVEIHENQTSDLGTIVLRRQFGSIDVSSEPNGLPFEIKPAGQLFVNPSDVRTGQTPASVSELPVGSYQVSISRPNWTTYTSTVTVERNGTARVVGNFPGGTVTITSSPSGATVLRDNQISVGSTPLTLNDLPPGPVSYTVVAPGMDPVTLNGRVEGGKNLSLNAVLLDSDRVMKLSELDERPVPVAQAEPELTDAMQVEGGSAVISFVVGRDGLPSDMKIEQASDPAFGRACLLAVTKWRFKPGMVNGKPAKSRVTIPFKVTSQ